MENYKQFEQELDSLESNPQSPLAVLRQSLRLNAPSRAPFHQSTSWTRLSARLTQNPEPTLHGFWLRFAVPCALGVLMAAFFFQPHHSNPSDSYASLDPAQMPVVRSLNPHIYAKPFHSKEAKADVIWAVGYDYIPAR